MTVEINYTKYSQIYKSKNLSLGKEVNCETDTAGTLHRFVNEFRRCVCPKETLHLVKTVQLCRNIFLTPVPCCCIMYGAE